MTHDREIQIQLARRQAGAWLEEEADEFQDANTDAEEIDALYDSLGIIILALTLYHPQAIKHGFVAYTEAQVARGRPLDFHMPIIRSLIAGMFPRESDDPAEQPHLVFLDRALRIFEAKMQKKKG
jgi:hypothetical protein